MVPASLAQTLSSDPIPMEEIADRLSVVSQMLAVLPEEPSGPALLYEVLGAHEVRALPLADQEVIVGRKPLTADGGAGSHLAFPDASKLSSRHFAIRRQGEEYTFEDLGSKNGTFINTSTARATTRTLVSADIIYAGGIRFAFIGE